MSNTTFSRGVKRFSDLIDVPHTTPGSQQILEWNGSAFEWVPSANHVGPSLLNDLVDVATGGAQDRQVLGYDGAVDRWVPMNATPTKLNDLTDVSTTGSEDGQILRFNSDLNRWMPGNILLLKEVGDVSIGNLDIGDTGKVLTWDNGQRKFIVQSIPQGITRLTNLTDVSTSGIGSGQLLQWNGTAFVPYTIPTPTFLSLADTANVMGPPNSILKVDASGSLIGFYASLPATQVTGLSPVATSGDYASLNNKPFIPSTLDDLLNVTAPTANTGQVLTFTGTGWAPTTLNTAFLGLTDTADVYSGAGRFVVVNQTNNGIEFATKTVNDLATSQQGARADSAVQPQDLHSVATSGSYDDLNHKPFIPAGLGDLSDVSLTTLSSNEVLVYNGSHWTAMQRITHITDLIDSPNSYSSSVPNGFVAVNPNQNGIEFTNFTANSFAAAVHTHQAGQINGLHTIATSGSYSDLDNKPSLFSGDYNDLANKPVLNQGSVTSVGVASTTMNVTGSPITSAGNINVNLAPIVAAGSYSHADITIDMYGRVTAAQDGNFNFVNLSDTSNSPVAGSYVRWNSTGTTLVYETAISSSNISGLSAVATTGNWNDISNKPAFGSAALANISAFATAAQGAKADTAIQQSDASQFATAAQGLKADSAVQPGQIGTASAQDVSYFATAEQGAKADTAVQSASIKSVALSGYFLDLVEANTIAVANGFLQWSADMSKINYVASIPSSAITGLGTASTMNIGDVATAAQGAKADSAVQPASLAAIATSGQWADIGGKPAFSGVATSGNYADLSGTPSLVAIATTGNWNDLTNKPAFHEVAVSGSYSDLNGKPMIPTTMDDLSDTIIVTPSINQIITWTGTHWENGSYSYNDLVGVPTFSTVASSGSIEDLHGSDLTIGPTSARNAVSITHQSVAASGTAQPFTIQAQTAIQTNDHGSDLVLNAGLSGGGTGNDGAVIINGAYVSMSNRVVKNVASPVSGTDAANRNYVDQAITNAGSGTSSIAAATDVQLNSPASSQVLKYNGTKWINASVAWSEISSKPTFSTVATSGSFADLSNVPNMADYAQNTALKTIAFTGDYNDIQFNKPPAILSGTSTLDFGTCINGTTGAVNVVGAAIGDAVSIGVPPEYMTDPDIYFTAWVSAVDTVTIRVQNSGGAITGPGSYVFNARVIK